MIVEVLGMVEVVVVVVVTGPEVVVEEDTDHPHLEEGEGLGLDPGIGKDPEVGVETGEETDLGLAAETERELIVTTRVLHDLNQGLQVDQRADLYQNLKVAQEVRKMT